MLPSLAPNFEPASTLVGLGMVVVADDLARQGHFADAAQHLADMVGKVSLSGEGLAAVMLRKARYWRRAGQRAKSAHALHLAEAAARRAHASVCADLDADCAMQRARLAYEADPVGQAHKLDFARLQGHLQLSTSPRLRWEWANLQGLTLRRRIEKLMPASPDRAAALVDAALQAHSTALYWLVVAQDPYHTQAVVINYAYLLQRLAALGLKQTLGDAVDAYRLAATITNRFELVEDSAWDYIMLGQLWLEQPQVREQVRTDARLWPGGFSPADAAFYERACQLAQAGGDARQLFEALELQAGFLRETGHARAAARVLTSSEELLTQHPDLSDQVRGKGFRRTRKGG